MEGVGYRSGVGGVVCKSGGLGRGLSALSRFMFSFLLFHTITSFLERSRPFFSLSHSL